MAATTAEVQEALAFVQKVPSTEGGSLYEHLTKLVVKVGGAAVGTGLPLQLAAADRAQARSPSNRMCTRTGWPSTHGINGYRYSRRAPAMR